MRSWIAALAATAIAIPVTAQAAPPHASANASACPNLPPDPDMGEARKTPLPIPAALSRVVRSGRDQLAVQTLGAGTFCIDARQMLQADHFSLSLDQRFLAFNWTGYEADGHVIVDRTGRGQQIETGVPVTLSPSGNRFAAVQISEAAFGGLEGFAVWQILPVGLRRLTFLDNLPQMEDWRLDGWAGENCINLSARPLGGNARSPRTHYAAKAGAHDWAVTRGACPRA